MLFYKDMARLRDKTKVRGQMVIFCNTKKDACYVTLLVLNLFKASIVTVVLWLRCTETFIVFWVLQLDLIMTDYRQKGQIKLMIHANRIYYQLALCRIGKKS